MHVGPHSSVRDSRQLMQCGGCRAVHEGPRSSRTKDRPRNEMLTAKSASGQEWKLGESVVHVDHGLCCILHGTSYESLRRNDLLSSMLVHRVAPFCLTVCSLSAFFNPLTAAAH